MPVQNSEIARIFDELADLLALEDANRFRIRAYRAAASTIRDHPTPMANLIRQGEDLSKLPTIGDDLADKIRTIVDTGHLPMLDQATRRTPEGLSELMHIEGLGPKRVRRLHDQLGIDSIDDLARAAQQGKIRELSGFGAKTEEKIAERVAQSRVNSERTRLIDAEAIAEPLVAWLEKADGVETVTVAGSLRRHRETVGDLDILVVAKKGSDVGAHFTDYPEVDEVVSQGSTRASVKLRGGLAVDLRVVPRASFGAALVYFTGSKSHNIALRGIARRKGFKLNEYGVFDDGKSIAGATEASVYKALGFPEIPPELREHRGELEAARGHRLPKLIQLDDLRGDLHCHTNASDGNTTLARMVDAAVELGHEYIAISDHSEHLRIAHGLTAKQLARQITAIDALNGKRRDIVVLKSIEVDILEDGRLDLPDSVLADLDFTVCAVHDHFKLTRKQQTERIIRAMDNPHFNILAHPTGRLINRRPAYQVDVEALLKAAKERGCAVELNSDPYRLDLDDEHCRMAKEIGVPVVISTDAHSTHGLEHLRHGVYQARRGWLEKSDVLNTLTVERLRKSLRRT